MSSKAVLLALLFLAFLPSSAHAGLLDGYAAGDQTEEQVAMRNAWLVRVKRGEKARFYNRAVTSGCPDLKSVCREKAYLIPGDVAVAFQRIGTFTLVGFVGKTGKPTKGAIEARLLENVSEAEPVARDWVGKWKYTDEQRITIFRTRTSSILAFQGDATWGAGIPVRVRNGGVHMGSFEAYVRPTRDWAGFVSELTDGDFNPNHEWPALSMQKGLNTDWSLTFPKKEQMASHCSASFRLLGPYLLAYTPVNACGGMNVSFTGVYRRISR